MVHFGLVLAGSLALIWNCIEKIGIAQYSPCYLKYKEGRKSGIDIFFCVTLTSCPVASAVCWLLPNKKIAEETNLTPIMRFAVGASILTLVHIHDSFRVWMLPAKTNILRSHWILDESETISRCLFLCLHRSFSWNLP